MCTSTDGVTPGRCLDAPGGCNQGGAPCDSGTNCCSRLCLDLGTGAKVCQPAGGCRMTGDYCDSSAACCGGTGQTRLPPNSASYNITCDSVKHDCANGTGCNPPGNICGGVVGFNASQNCCDGKKAVCKPDSNGIARCFGGCPNDNCTTTCPTGYDATNPLCCIEPAHVCEFSDQCCNGQACAPDPNDGMILKCGGGASACTPFGASCTGTSDTSCCTGSGLTCTKYGESGFFACLPSAGTTPVTPVSTCLLTGGACTAGTACCSGLCTSGKCADWTGPGGSGTSTSCQAPGGTCTGDVDCCAGSACGIPDGATHGTCQAAVAVCAATSQSCSTGVPCCSATDTCTNGACTPPSGCGSAYQACSATASCCTGYSCIDVATSVACAGGTCLCAPQASQ